jgi:hypothetical protein
LISLSTSNNCSTFHSLTTQFLHCRTYYLKASSEAQCRAVVESITNLSRLSREAAEKTSRLRRIQGMVRETYESTPFQSAVALLIMAVRDLRMLGRRGLNALASVRAWLVNQGGWVHSTMLDRFRSN